ncbi:hypothetical protein KP509_23G004000 [Ceratopteris richardii]|uniref:Reverse transcriptase domain-containing protein n=1 Tax=Ceratopteris richardii TaxID=49495 RepID=A0A8T2RX41_CERRI|nr:hypothetical protein KP509_23G004000 [Ceratopteris richardii]
MEVNDLHANSKCFFDFLRAKCANAAISSLEFNGQIVQDGNSIAHACTEYFEKLFAASFSTSDAWFTAIQDSLSYTPQIIDSRTADNCEKFITEEEVLMALQSLKNGKAPGLDGFTKEFVMPFWPSLKTLILDACNEIWSCQKMPFSFKQGKIKLIPKVEIPKKIGDWRPITMKNIIHKIFAKIFAMRLKPIIHTVVHPSQIGSHVGVGFVDDTFIFAKAEARNVQNILACLDPFSEASSLCINMGKSVLINISARHFESLPWYGPKVDTGTAFRHLGYPLDINVPIKDKICWVLCKVRAKMELWQASQWPLHIRIRIPGGMCQPKTRGGLGILYLHAHIMERRAAFIMRITSPSVD